MNKFSKSLITLLASASIFTISSSLSNNETVSAAPTSVGALYIPDVTPSYLAKNYPGTKSSTYLKQVNDQMNIVLASMRDDAKFEKAQIASLKKDKYATSTDIQSLATGDNAYGWILKKTENLNLIGYGFDKNGNPVDKNHATYNYPSSSADPRWTKWMNEIEFNVIAFASVAEDFKTLTYVDAIHNNIYLRTQENRNGWEKLDGYWFYFRKGTPLSNWQKINGSWYYFGENREMKTGWQKVNGSWYLLSNSGAMKTGWQKVNGSWYLLSNSGVMKTGWQKVNNKWYFLDNSGAMKTGWLKQGRTWYLLNNSGVWVK